MVLLVFAVLFLALVVVSRVFMRQRARPLVAGDVVIVTGASSGIGEYTAYEFARSKKARLVLAARRRDRLESVAARCRELGAPDVAVVEADVTSDADCKRLVEEAVRRFQRIDVLMLNAGMGCYGEFDTFTSLEPLIRTMDINYWGCVRPTMYALPHLRRVRGRIAVISSLAGKVGVPRRTGYAPTKHALQGFYDSLRMEIGSEVTISLICPGFVMSEIHDKAFGPKVERNKREFMSTPEAASRIVACIDRGDREVIMTTLAAIGFMLRPFMPELLDYVAKRKALAALENKQE